MRLVIICLLTGALGACGTVTRGSTESVAFQSEPPGASVTTSLGSGCPATPCRLEVARKQDFEATFSLPGYRSAMIPVGTVVSGGGGASMAGNILVGGIIGAGVDAYNGTAFDHNPNPVIARLEPLGAAPALVRNRPARRRPAAAPAT